MIHKCPPRGQALTPCCRRIVFELHPEDQLTLSDWRVTCTGRKGTIQRRDISDALAAARRHLPGRDPQSLEEAVWAVSDAVELRVRREVSGDLLRHAEELTQEGRSGLMAAARLRHLASQLQ